MNKYASLTPKKRRSESFVLLEHLWWNNKAEISHYDVIKSRDSAGAVCYSSEIIRLLLLVLYLKITIRLNCFPASNKIVG